MKFFGLALAALPTAVLAQYTSTWTGAPADASAAAVQSSGSNSATAKNGTTPLTSNNSSSSSAPVVQSNANVQSTILVLAKDAASANSATSGLNGYGIPYQTLIVPQAGVSLPPLNSSTGGNYGGIIVVSQTSYDYGAANGGFKSALSQDQWNTIYAYQLAYGVRLVHYDVYPGPLFGATALGGCCNTGVEQLVSFSNTTAFSQAGLKPFAGVSTQGLYHYPATISDRNTTIEIAQFAANANFATNSTAAVINNFSGRQQMAFFIGFATDWSPTSNFLQHASITWLTRGLYAGFRRVNLNTQIDDMFLGTDMYYPKGNVYRTTPNDMAGHAKWIPTIQSKMNPGSYFRVELGYNGNGNILASETASNGVTACAPGSIDTGDHNDTALEFQKPLGTGSDAWPKTPNTYPYTTACTNLDPLKTWISTTSNRDAFMHISHTFTHYELNNATYNDALKEIQFNQAWMQQVGIAAGNFTSNGLIPPAITGLHNGDVLRAWTAAGLTNCVGDNTRVPLRNSVNSMWPYITNVANNGFDGFQVIPRWATRIYYNCDTPDCTTREWIETSAGAGTFADLLSTEKADTMRHLFGLYREGYMFHQANLRLTNVQPISINGVSSTLSIFQAWTETIVQEFTRLVNWPMMTLKQSDLAKAFMDRMTRDKCNYKLTYSSSKGKIVAVSITATSNTCSVPIPVTVPGNVQSTQGFVTEKVGNDPLTIWVKLTGRPVTLSLSSPVDW